MAVVIRMKRTGRRNRPCYRISVADRAKPRDGRTLDNLGVYDPASPKEELRLSLDVEKAKDWISRGAIPSETVRSILRKGGVFEGMPAKKVRKRPGRKVVTKTRAAQLAKDARRAEAKKARREARLAEKRAARKAAAEAAAEEA